MSSLETCRSFAHHTRGRALTTTRPSRMQDSKTGASAAVWLSASCQSCQLLLSFWTLHVVKKIDLMGQKVTWRCLPARHSNCVSQENRYSDDPTI